MSEVLGWRGWTLREDAEGPLLISPQRTTPWLGPVLEADRKPRRWHRHGIYAVVRYDEDFTEWDVFGQVSLLGRVVVGEMGYRAERAIIRSLYLSRRLTFLRPMLYMASLREELGQRYGVEVGAHRPPIYRSTPRLLGVLRLLDDVGRVRDSAPYFGGPVRFTRSPTAFTTTGARLDLSDGTQSMVAFPAIYIAAMCVPAIQLHVWAT